MRFRAEVLTDVDVSLKIVGCDCEFEESFLTSGSVLFFVIVLNR